MHDLVFRNVRLLDGTGSEPVQGDLAVADGRIAAIGEAGPARTEIDGAGAILAPGFIDTHAHDDGAFFRHPGMEFKLAQGVTSVVSGNCGFSAIPADPSKDSVAASGGILAGLAGEFTDLDGYFAAVLERQPAINNMMLVGHNTVRSLVMEADKSAPSAAQLVQMQGYVRQALEQGACGFSTGLIYRPGRYSDTEEVIALAEQAAPYDALYTTHMRNEGDRLLEAVDESLRIAAESDVHLHISHHKAAGKPNWGKVRESLAKVDNALRQGQRVTLDVYPYTAGSGRMIEYFNLDRVSEELAEVIRIASCPAFREYEGRMLKDIAAEQGMGLTEAVKHVLTAPKGDRTICIHFIIDETDIETNLAHADMMVGSDGIPDLRGRPHPRLFGTFPRVLGHYVRERGVLSLEEAVRRLTSDPADMFGIKGRGRLEVGAAADVTVFDPTTIGSKNRGERRYDLPGGGKRMVMPSKGVEHTFVNGELTYTDGTLTDAKAGQLLRS